MINGKNSNKLWIVVPEENMTLLQFRKVLCDKMKCTYDDRMELSIEGYEFLETETVKILRDGDVLKCFIPGKKGKFTNTTGTQCKSLIRYSSRATQCDSANEEYPKPALVPEKATVSKSVATSSTGYRTTGRCGYLVSDALDTQTKHKFSKKTTTKSKVKISKKPDFDDSYAECHTSSSSNCDSGEDKYFSAHDSKRKKQLGESSSKRTAGNKTVNCDNAEIRVPPHLWRYYDNLGWSIYDT